MANPKKAFGDLKCPRTFAPNPSVVEMNAVMAIGGIKYGPYNFRDIAIDATTYIGAIRRHLDLWEDGEDFDDETGLSHLAHIMACAALARDAQLMHTFNDDRPKTGLMPVIHANCQRLVNSFKRKWEQKNER